MKTLTYTREDLEQMDTDELDVIREDLFNYYSTMYKEYMDNIRRRDKLIEIISELFNKLRQIDSDIKEILECYKTDSDPNL